MKTIAKAKLLIENLNDQQIRYHTRYYYGLTELIKDKRAELKKK